MNKNVDDNEIQGSKRRKILFITNYFPPRPAVAGRRLGHMARWAKRRYGEVFVIRSDRNFPGRDLPGLNVTAIPARDLRSFVASNGPAHTLPHSSYRGKIYGPLLRLRQSFPFLYLTDDGGPDYQYRAFRVAKRLIEQKGIDTMFSSFRPWTDHLIARRLKRRYPHLHWIADFRDLHADPVRKDVWWPALQKRWAGWVIKRADEVWGVSEGQVQYLKEINAKAKIRRNHLVGLPPERTAPRTERFTIVYTGSLYPRLQSITPLVNSVNRLCARGDIDPTTIELVYRGKDEALWNEWTGPLDPKVRRDTAGYVAPTAARELQRRAQLLLLLTWSAPNYYGVLTAKLYDYLHAGRPIMALVHGPGDEELRSIIEGCHAGRVFSDEAMLESWLVNNYRKWRAESRTLPWSPNREKLTDMLEQEELIPQD